MIDIRKVVFAFCFCIFLTHKRTGYRYGYARVRTDGTGHSLVPRIFVSHDDSLLGQVMVFCAVKIEKKIFLFSIMVWYLN